MIQVKEYFIDPRRLGQVSTNSTHAIFLTPANTLQTHTTRAIYQTRFDIARISAINKRSWNSPYPKHFRNRFQKLSKKVSLFALSKLNIFGYNFNLP